MVITKTAQRILDCFALHPCEEKKLENETNSLENQIQQVQTQLDLAMQRFDTETDFDQIESTVYLMHALEIRLNYLFLQAKNQEA